MREKPNLIQNKVIKKEKKVCKKKKKAQHKWQNKFKYTSKHINSFVKSQRPSD